MFEIFEKSLIFLNGKKTRATNLTSINLTEP